MLFCAANGGEVVEWWSEWRRAQFIELSNALFHKIIVEGYVVMCMSDNESVCWAPLNGSVFFGKMYFCSVMDAKHQHHHHQRNQKPPLSVSPVRCDTNVYESCYINRNCSRIDNRAHRMIMWRGIKITLNVYRLNSRYCLIFVTQFLVFPPHFSCYNSSNLGLHSIHLVCLMHKVQPQVRFTSSSP